MFSSFSKQHVVFIHRDIITLDMLCKSMEQNIPHIGISSPQKLSNDSSCHTRPGLLKRVNGFAIIFMLKSSTSDIKIVPALLCLRDLYSLFHIGEAESLLEVMTASKQSAELF